MPKEGTRQTTPGEGSAIDMRRHKTLATENTPQIRRQKKVRRVSAVKIKCSEGCWEECIATEAYGRDGSTFRL